MQERLRLGAAVVDALAAAGLSAHLVGPGDSLVEWVAGAVVEIDQFDDEAGGVFVDWNASHELVERFEAPLLAHEFDHPDIRLNAKISEVMRAAMGAILSASGFEVAEEDDEYRPFSLRVVRTI